MSLKIFKLIIFTLISSLALTQGAYAQLGGQLNPPNNNELDLFYDEFLIERIRGSQDVEYFYDSPNYLKFLSALPEKKSSTRATRVIKFAVEALKNMIEKEKKAYARNKFLDEIKIISVTAMYYAHKNKDRVLIRYLHKLHTYESVQRLYSNVSLEPKENLEESLRKEHRNGLEIIINEYLKRVLRGEQKVPDPMDYMGTKIEIFYEEIKSGEKTGNVTYITPKNERKKVHNIRILFPSEYAAEAVLVATEILLKNPLSEGVYFDDRLKIPSKLAPDSYTATPLGSNVLLTRPICANLFQ